MHRLHDSFDLYILEWWWGWEDAFRVWSQKKTQDECVRVPPPKVQKVPLFVEPANRQALKTVYGFRILDRDFIVLIFVKILDT